MCVYGLFQGIIVVYDITNKWSFDGIDRWLKEVEEVIKFKRFFWCASNNEIRFTSPAAEDYGYGQ